MRQEIGLRSELSLKSRLEFLPDIYIAHVWTVSRPAYDRAARPSNWDTILNRELMLSESFTDQVRARR